MRTELTLQEVLDIAQTVAMQSTYIERKMVKDILVLETLSVKSLGNKVDTMDNKFCAKFQEVDNKINDVDDKTKIDLAETTTDGIKESIKKGIIWLVCGGGLATIIMNLLS